MKKNFTWLLLLAGLSFSVPSMAQNFAISLDGATNSVTTPAQIVPAGADFTVEFWAYVPSLVAGNHEFVSQGTVGLGALYIGYDGTGQIRVGDNWTSTGVQVPLGSWFHLAVTYFHATTTANLYINDIIAATTTTFSFAAGGSNFAIGEQTDGTELMQAEMDELNVWSVARTQASIKGSMLHGLNPADPTFPNVVAYYKMNEGSGTVLTNISNTAGLDGTLNGTVSGSTWASSPIQYSPNGLAFDGVNSNVAVPPNALWDGLSSATFEMNANPSASLSGNGDMLGVRGPGGATGAKFSLHMSPTAIGLYNGSSFTFGAVTFVSTPGTWYHISYVVDGVMDTTGVFVDGNYIGQIAQGLGTNTGAPLVMGVDSNGGGNAEPFAGSLDEVRIWNTKLTQAQIQTYMGDGLVGNEPNLIALWNFDEGIPGGNNSFLNTAFEGTASNNHGKLSSFALTGTTSNFVTGSTITPLPVDFTTFTAVARGKEAILTWQTAQEQNSRDYTVERSPDGTPNSFTAIGIVPAAGNSSTKLNYEFRDVSPLIGMNFYQLKETDLDDRFMYSPLRSLEFAFSGSNLFWHKTGDKAVEVDLIQGNSDNYTVTDILGRTIQQGQMSFGKIYLNHVPAGIYVVRIFSPSGPQFSTKVLVQ